MVSTRGVKFKFSEGERVLCYEPDPTKAKVLYDSKVLELNVSRDNRGRKVPEYLIHFYGWSSSWDRCVKEEFILQDTEENRNLQNRLAEEAALSLKNRRKTKIPPIIKESLAKKELSDTSKETTPADVKEQIRKISSDSDSSDDDVVKIVTLDIPHPLKLILNKDRKFIKQENKVIRLPCEQNVISILEGFVKHFATDLLSNCNSKVGKNGKEISLHEAQARINFCKEVMDGVRTCFDFTLAHLLLYNNEKKQHYSIGNTCVPVRWSTKSDIKEEFKKNSENMGALSCFVNLQKDAKAVLSSSTSHHAVTRGGLRNQGRKQVSSQEDTTNATSLSSNTRHRRSRRGSSNRVRSSGLKKPRAIGSRPGLRSRDKQHKPVEDIPTTSTNSVTENSSAVSATSRPESPPTPTSPSRQTRRSSQVSPSPVSPTSNRSPSLHKKTVNINSVNIILNQPVVSLQPDVAVYVKNLNSVPASNSPTPVVLSPKIEKVLEQADANSNLLKEVLAWRMLPKHVYEQIPAAPTTIYGSHHLLRLFVKLPQLIHRMNIPKRNLLSLMGILEKFLQYLSDPKMSIFQDSSYIDSGEENVE